MSDYRIEPVSRVEGALSVPGDKSISHRALMISAAGMGDCAIRGLSTAQDVASTILVLKRLADLLGGDKPFLEGDGSGTPRSGWEILVRGRGLAGWRNPGRTLDCGNSGTTIRVLVGLLAGCEFQTTLDGDDSLRRRPMERVAVPLRRMGATVITGEGGTPPIVIRGAQLNGIDYALETPSAQVKTAVLLAGVHADGETIVSGGGSSRDHTERLLRYLGVAVDGSPDRLIVKSTEIQNAETLEIPGDISSASFLLAAAALVPGSDLVIRDVGLNPTRAGFLDVLRRFGAHVSIEGEREAFGEPVGTVRVRPGDRRPLRIEPHEVPAVIDELPLVALLGSFAEGTTVIEGASELRVKESDRIASTIDGLRAMGVEAEASADGLEVRGGSPAGGAVDARGDHRIAMTFAVAGLAASGPVTVNGWEAVAVSYPSFAADLTSVSVPLR